MVCWNILILIEILFILDKFDNEYNYKVSIDSVFKIKVQCM